MTNNNENRVLLRMGAHELTQEETEKIVGTGNNLNTLATAISSLPQHYTDLDQ